MLLLPAAKAMFLASHAALLDDAAERAALMALAERRMAGEAEAVAALGPQGASLLALVDNRDPESVERLVAALPASVRGFLLGLSLRRQDLSPLAGRLVLIHGREDRVIPWQESRDLTAAVPGTELFVIDGFSHIEPGGVGIAGRLQLVEAVHALLRRRDALR